MSAVPKLARKIGSQRVLRYSLLLGCGLYVGLFMLHITTSIHIWVHLGINALASGISGLSNMMQWGMLSEAIEYNEYLTGKRTEGSINGTFNMLRRLGQGLGASFGVAMLGMIGYNASASIQSSETILGIKVLCLLLPAVFSLGSWAVFKFLWNITPEVRKAMAEQK
jgi:GPH family glycoside/pentoside/hexuronide:cation symporter